MIRRDLKNNTKEIVALAYALRTASVNGATIDLKDFGSVMFLIQEGAFTDGVHTLKLQDSDDGSAWSDVAAIDLHGAFAVLSALGVTQRVGYRGPKRFVRLVITVTGASTGAASNALAVKGHAQALPTD